MAAINVGTSDNLFTQPGSTRKIVKTTTGKLVLFADLGVTNGINYKTSSDNGDTWDVDWTPVYNSVAVLKFDILIEDDNNILLSIVNYDGWSDLLFIKLTYSSGTWSVGTPVEIVTNAPLLVCSITLRSNGDIWIGALNSNSGGSADCYYSTDGGINWNLTSFVSNSYAIQLIPKGSNIWAFVIDATNHKLKIYEYTSSWDSGTIISGTSDYIYNGPKYLAAVKISDTNIWVSTFMIDFGDFSFGLCIYNYTGSWSTRTKLTTQTQDTNPSLQNRDGNPIFCYQKYVDASNSNIAYQIYNGASWDTEVALTSSGANLAPTLVTTDAYRLMVVYEKLNSYEIYFDKVSFGTPPIQQFLTSDAKIKVFGEQKTLVSDTFIINEQRKFLTSDVKIKVFGEQKTLVSDTKIVDQYRETILSDANIIIRYNGKFIHNDDIFVVTDTNPAQIIKINLNDLTYIKYTITGKQNAKELTINHDREFIYISLKDGYVAKIDTDDPSIQTILNVGESEQLYSIVHNPTYLTTFVADSNVDDSLFIIDEATYEKINTDLRTIALTQKVVNTFIGTVFGIKINTDLRTLLPYSNKINTDLRFIKKEYSEITYDSSVISRNDFTITIDGTLLGTDDLILDSITIIHTNNEYSTAEFTLTRKHDDVNNPTTITNHNNVIIYIKGIQEFEGKISKLNCDSQTEKIIVNCESEDTDEDYGRVTKDLPLTVLNTQLHLYDVLLNNIEIINPELNTEQVIIGSNGRYWDGSTWRIDINLASSFSTFVDAYNYIIAQTNNLLFNQYAPTVTNKEITNLSYYKGVKVNLGTAISQNIINLSAFRYPFYSVTEAAEKISDGTFKFLSGYTYFWQVDVDKVKLSNGFIQSINSAYIGTSLASLSTDLYNITGVNYITQKVLDDTETLLGYYLLGSAPYKEISVKNGAKIVRQRYEDREDGLYLVFDSYHNYTDYAIAVAALEYEKIKNINGDILPITSANIDLTIDAYLFYDLKLLNLINLTNTTSPNIYKNANGFPISIKQITISSSTMKVSLSNDNTKSQYDLNKIDELYPLEPGEFPGQSSLYRPKFDLNNWEYIYG